MKITRRCSASCQMWENSWETRLCLSEEQRSSEKDYFNPDRERDFLKDKADIPEPCPFYEIDLVNGEYYWILYSGKIMVAECIDVGMLKFDICGSDEGLSLVRTGAMLLGEVEKLKGVE